MKKWLHSLLSVFIGGGANTITLMAIDPLKFNLQDGWKNVVTGFLLGGVLSAAFYLKQSPLPQSESFKKETTQKLAAFAVLLTTAMLFVGCASNQTSVANVEHYAIVAPANNATFTNAVGVSCALLKSGGQLALTLALNDDERKQYATYLSGSGHLFESLQTGKLPTDEEISNALSAYFPTESGSYTSTVQISATAINAIVAIVETYVPVNYVNYAEYVNYCFGQLAKVAYEVADPYLE